MRRLAKDKALSLLKAQLEPIAKLKRQLRDNPHFDKWWQMTRTILANVFGQDSPQLSNFLGIHYSLTAFSSSTPDTAWQRAYVGGLDTAEAQLEALIHEIQTFWDDKAPEGGVEDAISALHRVFDRFHQVARQLRSRHADRATLSIVTNMTFRICCMVSCAFTSTTSGQRTGLPATLAGQAVWISS